MYELMETGCIVVIGIMGIMMVIAPKKVAKKSLTENPSKLMIVRILGALMTVGCAAVLIMMFHMNQSYY